MSDVKLIGGGTVNFDTRVQKPLSIEAYRFPVAWSCCRPLRTTDVVVVGSTSFPLGMAVSYARLVFSYDDEPQLEVGIVNVLGRELQPARHALKVELFEPSPLEMSVYWEVEQYEEHDGGSVWIIEVEAIGSLELAKTAMTSEREQHPDERYRIVEVTRRVVHEHG